MATRPWTQQEVEAAVDVYFGMLARELRGEAFVKAEEWRRLIPRLEDRSKGSVEFKFENISAVLHQLGFAWIEGYKPKVNYQKLLLPVVQERLAADSALQRLASARARRVPPLKPLIELADPARQVEPPEHEDSTGRRQSKRQPPPRLHFDFAERDAANRRLGERGERFVLEIERERLRRAGRADLARQVEWTSKEIGDGTGYDITSYRTDGEPRLLEVKTTNLHRRFPFVVTRNEVAVSEERHRSYELVRVFDFSHDPRFFVLPGALSKTLELEPKTFTARV
jgi:hypothetical protein